MARTAAEIEAEIDEIQTALSHIRKGGQSYTIDTGSSKRSVTMADYEMLRRDLRDLYSELKDVEGTSGMSLRAGW